MKTLLYLLLAAVCAAAPLETKSATLRRLAQRYEEFAVIAERFIKQVPDVAAPIFFQRAAAYREVAATLRKEANEADGTATPADAKDLATAQQAADEATVNAAEEDAR